MGCLQHQILRGNLRLLTLVIFESHHGLVDDVPKTFVRKHPHLGIQSLSDFLNYQSPSSLRSLEILHYGLNVARCDQGTWNPRGETFVLSHLWDEWLSSRTRIATTTRTHPSMALTKVTHTYPHHSIAKKKGKNYLKNPTCSGGHTMVPNPKKNDKPNHSRILRVPNGPTTQPK